MGNALKIRKYQGAQVVDQGFPNDGTTDNGYNDNNPGIVGGIYENSDMIECRASILVKGNGTITASTGTSTVTGTATNFNTDSFNTENSQLWVSDGAGGYTSVGIVYSVTDDGELSLGDPANINVTDSEWYYNIMGYASIVRQKGSRTFLVAGTNNNIQDESIAIGQAYMIVDPSNTDWVALGADPTAGQYDIFTATASGHGLATNGVVWAVSQCVLVDSSTPSGVNQMRVQIYDDGSTYNAQRIKNKFSTNFDQQFVGCNPGITYSATFFNNGGNTLPNPSAPGDRIYTEVGTENWC